MSKRINLNQVLAPLCLVPLLACASVAPPREVRFVFEEADDAKPCKAEYYVENRVQDTVTLYRTAGKDRPNQATWTFQSDYYDLAWVVLEDNGLAECLDDIDSFPGKNKRGFPIKPGGTTQTVVASCDLGAEGSKEFDYLIRAKKRDGKFCGADPKVKILD